MRFLKKNQVAPAASPTTASAIAMGPLRAIAWASAALSTLIDAPAMMRPNSAAVERVQIPMTADVTRTQPQRYGEPIGVMRVSNRQCGADTRPRRGGRFRLGPTVGRGRASPKRGKSGGLWRKTHFSRRRGPVVSGPIKVLSTAHNWGVLIDCPKNSMRNPFRRSSGGISSFPGRGNWPYGSLSPRSSEQPGLRRSTLDQRVVHESVPARLHSAGATSACAWRP